MAPRSYKSWIFTRAREYTPEGVLQPGQILYNPFNPATTLLKTTEIATLIESESSSAKDMVIETSEELEKGFGAWAKVAGLPVGLSADGKTTDSSKVKWHFESLSGKITTFNLKEVRAVLEHEVVKDYFESVFFPNRIFRRLYMVTGVRVAKGARMEKENKQHFTAKAEAEGDGTPANVPVQAGANVHVAGRHEDREAFSKATDFVFAYRLNQINFWPKVTQKAFTKGGTETTSKESGQDGQPKQTLELILDEESPLIMDEFDGDTGEEKKLTLPHHQNPDLEYRYFFETALNTDNDGSAEDGGERSGGNEIPQPSSESTQATVTH